MILLQNRCTRTWASMTGGVKERHCDGCGRLVYNWSALSPEERAEIKRQEPDACYLWPISVVRRA